MLCTIEVKKLDRLRHTKLQLRLKDTVNNKTGVQSDAPAPRKVIHNYIKKHGPLTPSEVAEGVDVKYNTVKSTMSRMNGDELAHSDPKAGRYDLKERVESEAQPQENHDRIYATVASQGDGSFEIGEEPVGYITGDDALSRPGREVFWMPVRGDSMEGTLPKKGLVPVWEFAEKLRELPDDDIYLFRLEGTIQIKRLQRRPGGRIRVVSDNNAYEDFEIAIDEGTDFAIIGRVLV